MTDKPVARADLPRWRANRQDELDSAALYRAVAEVQLIQRIHGRNVRGTTRFGFGEAAR